MSLCARAWDPRLTPESEFRDVGRTHVPVSTSTRSTSRPGLLRAAGGDPLPVLVIQRRGVRYSVLLGGGGGAGGGRAALVMRDCQATFNAPAVKAAVARLGGHCIVDFAWLGPGEVIVIELNPFDGVCLGTFPASTGLFLWDDPRDQAVMTGEAPFELRLRTRVLESERLWAQHPTGATSCTSETPGGRPNVASE